MCGTTSFLHVPKLILVNTQSIEFLQNGVACPYVFWLLPTHFCTVWLCIAGERLWCVPLCLSGVEQTDCGKWCLKGEQQRAGNLLLLSVSFPQDIVMVNWRRNVVLLLPEATYLPSFFLHIFLLHFFKFGVLCFQKIRSNREWSFAEIKHSHLSEEIMLSLQVWSQDGFMFINWYCIVIFSVVEIVPIVITRDSSVEKLTSTCLCHAPGFIRCV